MATKKQIGPGTATAAGGPAAMRRFERVAAVFEDETVRRALEPIGRDDLLGELGWPAGRLTVEAMNDHPVVRDAYPLHLEVRYCGRSNPAPFFRRRPLPPMEAMAGEFPGTLFHVYCVAAKKYDPTGRGFGVVFPYDGTAKLILHDRPHLAKGKPLVSRPLPNGCVVQVHWFEPFADDVADECRIRFAEEGSVLMRRIESNHPFRRTDWRLWADRPKPSGW